MKKLTGKVIGVWEKSVSLNIGKEDPLVIYKSEFHRNSKAVPAVGDKVDFECEGIGRRRLKDKSLSKALHAVSPKVLRVVDGYRAEIVLEDEEPAVQEPTQQAADVDGEEQPF